jgi:hypothetical protein
MRMRRILPTPMIAKIVIKIAPTYSIEPNCVNPLKLEPSFEFGMVEFNEYEKVELLSKPLDLV